MTLSEPRAPESRDSTRSWLLALALAAVTIVAYSNSFTGAFVFDDESSIVANPSIRRLADFRAILSPPPGVTASGRPVVNLTLALNYAVSGTNPWSYHAVNLLIHLSAGLVLFGIIRRTMEGRALSRPNSARTRQSSSLHFESDASSPIAFFVSALWLLHPIQTESVTYIIQRTESLMGLFYLLTLYCFVRSADRWTVDSGQKTDPNFPSTVFRLRSTAWAGLSVAACLLGAATKEVMVTAPVVVLLYDRTFVSASFGAAWRARRGYYLSLACTWLFLAVIMAAAPAARHGFDTAKFSSWWGYWLTQAIAIVHYLRLVFWPYPLNFDYGAFYVRSVGEVAGAALLVVALVGAVVWSLIRRPVAGFLGASFLVILAPTSLMPGTIQMVVEHRMYLPLAAALVALALVLWKASPRMATTVLAAACCIFAILTFSRNRVYASEEILWNDVVARSPDNSRGWYNLGLVSLNMGHGEDAIRYFRRSLELSPGDSAYHNNLGNALLKNGVADKALAEFLRALELLPGNATYAYNVALAESARGNIAGAIKYLRDSVRFDPKFADGWNMLGVSLNATGQTEDAVASYERALAVAPDSFEPLNNLGSAMIKLGKFDEAIRWFEKARQLRPADSVVRVNLAIALVRSGKTADAIAQLREAVALDKDNADARSKLDTLLRAPNP